MPVRLDLVLAASTAAFALTACGTAQEPAEREQSASPVEVIAKVDHSDPIASAMAAAPAAIASAAKIVTVDSAGKMSTLRTGTNGFTCMPDNPVTPGPDPMCMDKNAMAWAMAWMGKTAPPDETPGIIYMLEGGTDGSNTDPYATQPAEGGDWIKTGPHLMIVGSAKALEGHPAGANPDTSAPYVMWAGSPYAHLMVPIS